MLPSFVITGYLGSGKTTLLLNSVKEFFSGRRVALIVNEFGQIGVDGKILKNAYSEVIELPEGCICCTLHSEFEKALSEIKQKYDPELLFVETSGGAEPFPVIISLQSLGCTVEGVLCLIDAFNFEKYSKESTARHQIGSSNVLVINKTDLVEGEILKNIEKEVINLWHFYRLKNFFTGEPIFKDFRLYRTTHGKLPPEVFEGIFTLKERISIKEEESHEHNLKQEIRYFEEPIEYENFMQFIESLSKDVIRAKGIVRLRESPAPVVVNYAFGSIDMSYTIPDYEGKSFVVIVSSSN
ncbi:CobW family GTP-binding protein [Hydrogenobacter thermophilus]|uniref:CobW family GTP-binding protein n=1 Tax=Hydrogenobacter thermophilus TaxID=940 RepID=UPI0030FBD543